MNYDSPWKEVLETYFEAFLQFFFPQVHADIDWSRGYIFLDKELQQVVRDAELGVRRVDKLVKVWLRKGTEAWLLIHIEIQSQPETLFAQRMFVYHYRIYDRYEQQGSAWRCWRMKGQSGARDALAIPGGAVPSTSLFRLSSW